MGSATKPRGLREKLKSAMAEYGRLAIGVYLVMLVLVFAGSAAAIHLGFEIDGVSGTAGTLAAAWVATKLSQPLRILATVAITPALAAALGRASRQGPSKDAEA